MTQSVERNVRKLIGWLLACIVAINSILEGGIWCIGAVECGRIMPPYAVLKQIVQVLEIDGNTLFYENANEGASKMADIYLRKMDPTTQKLAIELLQTMANFRYPKTHKKNK